LSPESVISGFDYFWDVLEHKHALRYRRGNRALFYGPAYPAAGAYVVKFDVSKMRRGNCPEAFKMPGTPALPHP
jgi:hypothetical protein